MMYAITQRTGIGWAELDAMPVCQFAALLDCVLDEADRERRQQRQAEGRISIGDAAMLH